MFAIKRVHDRRSLLALALVAALGAGTTAYAQGKIEIVGDDTYNWGSVAPGTLKTVVEVRNVGSGDLNIEEVRPSCGCTIAPIDKKLLKPGDVGRINIKLDVSSRTGPVEKTITIASSDSSAPIRILKLLADVKRSLIFTPTSASLIVVDGKLNVEAPTTTVRLANASDSTFTVFPPELTKGKLKVRFTMTEKKELHPGEELEIKAYVTPLDREGIYGTISMKTTNPEYPTVDLYVAGNFAEPAQSSLQAIPSPSQK
jgi:hypothetical protein